LAAGSGARGRGGIVVDGRGGAKRQPAERKLAAIFAADIADYS
jgi:hypothetical protein